ncbi:hypothetical protein DUNSADRAFT_12042 [Dunaliella salina]|uniref:Uncharacterized protein n=1 Tax=Dunaliella salina TaxID=3046 RepID=A0ABQ7GC13_DUNSA|nr:hypothetical protein DUNSADRAFT_12042 [Dunaliella salina]|eukprot:KAF5832140.1 hypothetical protein DUNSADRAFT_12042 [Dunaliella salina]
MVLHSAGMRAGQACMLLLSILGGIIVIGGLGAASNQCDEHAYGLLRDLGDPNRTPDPDIATGLGTAALNHIQPFTAYTHFPDGRSAHDCGIHLSLDWWLVAYEIFTFIYGMAAVFNEFFHNKFSVMTIFSMKIMLATLITSVYVKLAYTIGGGDHSDIDMGQYTRTGAAGGIVILVANYIFLILFGTEEAPSVQEQEASVEIQK